VSCSSRLNCAQRLSAIIFFRFTRKFLRLRDKVLTARLYIRGEFPATVSHIYLSLLLEHLNLKRLQDIPDPQECH